MKTYTLILIGLLMLAVAGCSTPEQIAEQKVGEAIADTADAAKVAVVDKAVAAADKASQDWINMRCVENIGGVTYTYYLYKDKMRVDVKSPAENVDRQTWILDKMAYAKMPVNNKEYLLTLPVEESQLTYRSTEVAYQAFNARANAECEKDAVKESDFVLPSLEHITNDQLTEMTMQLMMTQGLPS